MSVKTIEQRAGVIIANAVDDDYPADYLARWVSGLPRADANLLATAYLVEQVRNRQRAAVRVIEKNAAYARQKPRKGTKAWDVWIETDDPDAVFEREMEAKEAQGFMDLLARMNGLVEDYAAELRIQWTAELLDSEFARGDGTKITWGDASADDHRYRIDMHMRNAAAGIEGAARHQAALALLDETGAASLNDALVAA